MPPSTVTVVDHPLVRHKLTLLRDRTTPTGLFRQVTRELSLLLAYEATRGLAEEDIPIDTPLEPMFAPRIAGKKLCLVSILRAGNGLLEGMLDLVPTARVGHIGLARDEHTLMPREYYLKLPSGMSERMTILVDPMLATGGSASAALARLKQAGARRLRFVCLLAAPEGLAALADAHPDVGVISAAIDRGLDERGYIRPGLGDAGDRLYGTR